MAVTALGSQLEALAVAAGQLNHIKAKSKASLIFSPSQAADVDLQTIFNLCDLGLEELAGMDRRFEAYRKSLFSAENFKLDRELQTREFNDKLNASIPSFLRLLSNYIMLKPAHQVLEYLIRRFKIHVYNVDDIVISILPYHETSLFVRIVQLLQLKKTKWSFLESVQKSGAPPTRAAVVNQCRSDLALLDTLCEAAIKVARMPSKTRTIASFTSIVLMEMLAAVPSVGTSTTNKILPFILHSFEGGITEEYRVGALMVVGTLANRTSLSSSLVESLTDSIARSIQKESASEGTPLLRLRLMVMIQLMQTQSLDKFPSKTFKLLVKVRVFYELLAKLVVMYDTRRFLSLFLAALVEHCASHEHYEQSLVTLMNTVSINDNVGQLVTNILELYMGKVGVEDGEQNISKAKEVAKRLFKTLERRFPSELDTAVSLCLQRAAELGKGGNGSVQQQALSEIFLGTLHMPLVASNSTLYLSLDHPEARVREAAVRQLAALLEAPNLNFDTEIKDMIYEALFRRGHDDDYGVVRTILLIKGFVDIPFPERLFKLLTSIIVKSVDTITSGSKVDVRAKSTATLALKLLASQFLELHPTFGERVAMVLFGLLIASSKTLKLSLAALKLAVQLPFPLYEGLSDIQDVLPEVKEGTKSQKEELRLQINEKVVLSLATCALERSETLFPVLFKAATENQRSKCLVLLVLSTILQKAPTDRILEFLKPCLVWLQDEWAFVKSGSGLDLVHAQQVDFEAVRGKVVNYQLLDTQPTYLSMQLLLKTMYQLLEVLPINTKGDSGASDDILKRLYELFSTARAQDNFRPHFELLLRRLSNGVFPFLSSYFTSEGSDASLQLHSHSLDLLALYYSQLLSATIKEGWKLERLTSAELEIALSAILIGLANPFQVVRRSAAQCLEKLYALSEKFRSQLPREVKDSPTESLDLNTFGKVLRALAEAKTACTSSEKYVATILESILHDGESQSVSNSKACRLKPAASKAVVEFLVAHALGLSTRSQVILFSVLKDTGHELERLSAVAGIMGHLLGRRAQYHLHNSPISDVDKLSPAEVDLLEVLLQMYTPRAALSLLSLTIGDTRSQSLGNLFEALKIEGGSTLDPAVVRPCLAALACFTSEFYKHLPVPSQEQVFQLLIELSSTTCSDIRGTTHSVLRTLKVPAIVISAYLRCLSRHDQLNTEIPSKKKRKVHLLKIPELKPFWSTPQQHLASAAAVLQVLVWLPKTDDRQELVAPLYELLTVIQNGSWLSPMSDVVNSEVATAGLIPYISLEYIQQLILIVLEDLATSLLSDASRKTLDIFDIQVLVQCVADTTDSTTRNQALMLLTAIAKVFPQRVLKHIIDILSIIGTSTITQNDRYSHDVTQQLLVAVVPCWLKSSKDPTTLLQVIVEALSRVPKHRRMSLVTTLLRVTKENVSLHVVLMLLLGRTTRDSNGVHGLEDKDENSADLDLWSKLWEVQFARDLCQQYEPNVWLPALVKLLQATSESCFPTASQFVTYQLQSLDESDTDRIPQEALIALLEQVVVQLQSGRKENQPPLVALLDFLTLMMAPTAYLEGLANLLKNSDASICRKVLRLYTTRMKMQDKAIDHPQKNNNLDHKLVDNNVLDRERVLQALMVSQITHILLTPTEDASANLKHAALEALKICAARLADTNHIGVLVVCLPAVVFTLNAKKKAVCVTGVHCLETLVSILGPRALPSLPSIVTQLLAMARRPAAISCQSGESKAIAGGGGPELILSVLKAIEVIVRSMGAFLNPYLSDIIAFLVLQPPNAEVPDANVTTTTAALRQLISATIPARLLLDPLIGAYEQALQVGEEATSSLFQMVAAVASKLDRASVPIYHIKIFNVCLQALDLRHSRPSTFTSVASVESSVILALVSLILKLSDNTFKPLFVNLLDWARTRSVDEGGVSEGYLDRNIAFYGLVNQLTEKLRSLFVPYFSYLMDGCIDILTGGQTAGEFNSGKPKKKKRKTSEGVTSAGLSLASWHLRQLVLSSLHKCFLYDTVGFLDPAKFQQLLGPIVAQLLVDAPSGLDCALQDDREKTATLEEMDDTVVSCLSQMALTTGTDLLWKPLNREVLMCTRSEKLRPRLLALRIVKVLAQQLKDEYLVLLAETIPFLAELLEDSELLVVAQCQEILKLLETTSGEDLSQYF